MRRALFSLFLRIFNLPKSAVPPERKGLIIILVDGLSHSALSEEVRKGRCTFISSLQKKGYRLYPYFCGLPAATTATEAELFFGSHDNIPGFTWFDRSLKRFIRGNRGEEIELFERTMEKKTQLLRDGSCILGVYSSGATLCDISGKNADFRKPFKAMSHLNTFLFVFMNPVRFAYTLYLMLKSIFSSAAVIILKKSKKSLKLLLKDALSNYILGNAATYIAELELLRETPVLFIDYVLFDEFAHMYGIHSRSSRSAIRLIDWYCESIYKASKKTKRQYDFLILSDHGQTPSRPLNRHPDALERLFSHALEDPSRTPVRTYGPLPGKKACADIYLVPAGSTVQAYFSEGLDKPLNLPWLEEKYPRLIPNLLTTREIGWVLVRDGKRGQILFGKQGKIRFADGGVDKSEGKPFSGADIDLRVLSSLAAYAGYENNGDLVLFGNVIGSNRVYSFEDHLGTHGGFYGDMTKPFILTDDPRIHRSMENGGNMENLFSLIRSSNAQA